MPIFRLIGQKLEGALGTLSLPRLSVLKQLSSEDLRSYHTRYLQTLKPREAYYQFRQVYRDLQIATPANQYIQALRDSSLPELFPVYQQVRDFFEGQNLVFSDLTDDFDIRFRTRELAVQEGRIIPIDENQLLYTELQEAQERTENAELFSLILGAKLVRKWQEVEALRSLIGPSITSHEENKDTLKTTALVDEPPSSETTDPEIEIVIENT